MSAARRRSMAGPASRTAARREATSRQSRARRAAPPPVGLSNRRHPRRGRRLAGLARFAVFLALVFAVAWGGVRVANATGEFAVVGGDPYVVHAGDTLWQIAVSHYGDAVPLRRAVHEIRQANGLRADHVLQPGETLLLPTVAPRWAVGLAE